jgi:hypothetical protein
MKVAMIFNPPVLQVGKTPFLRQRIVGSTIQLNASYRYLRFIRKSLLPGVLKISLAFLMGCLLACQQEKLREKPSRLDSAIAVRIKQWTNLPASYRAMGTIRTRTVLQVEWLAQQAQSRQHLVAEYKLVNELDNALKEEKQIQRQLEEVSKLLASNPNQVHHYEYLHTCQLSRLDGQSFQAQYAIEADTTDKLLSVRRHQ